MSKEFKHFETKLIHSGEPEPRINGSVSMPIFQSAMFEYAGEAIEVSGKRGDLGGF